MVRNIRSAGLAWVISRPALGGYSGAAAGERVFTSAVQWTLSLPTDARETSRSDFT